MGNILKTKEMGNLIVISGPSGAGKDTIVEKLKDVNDNLWVSVSMTSREIRSNDIPGETYYFVSRENLRKELKMEYF